ncbi:MAG: sigma-70 region 4 domain-containing protein [Firmicutes bacterium]|nr:sigma-70 region 4 domain-containing protein [Bacillota bacterium]
MHLEIRKMQGLSFRERQVVILKETGHTTGEIARRLGLSPGTVATLYNRARSKGYEVVAVIPGEALLPAEPEGEGTEE